MQFQSAPAHGGRFLHRQRFCFWLARFQSAPAHGGRCRGRNFPRWPIDVSIRARAWRAMCTSHYFTVRELVFQSAPAHGGRYLERRSSDSASKFQSAPAHGGRFSGAMGNVSIPFMFQSAPAHGGRSNARRANYRVASFNPRPRMAGDIRPRRSATVNLIVSIRARAWRAMCCCGEECKPPNLFQSAPAHGGRWAPNKKSCDQYQRFNPRPRMAGDVVDRGWIFAGDVFQSAPAHGGRLYFMRK